ncbi:MAG: tRNA (adenosine(37)-N6)-threonylcarbamoyltransferase complex dimerization subunit type 1 TsaB [Actinomycetota bacterium]
MLVLGIETSTPQSSVALGTQEGVLAAALLSRGKGHESFLAPAIRYLLDQAGLSPSAVRGVAVDLGPGLFTGMRVGIATGKAFAQALALPMVGVSSLDLLAFQARHCSSLICACIDGRRKEVFAAFYRQVPGGVQRETDFAVLTPARLAADIAARKERVLVVGNGVLAYREVFESLGRQVELGGGTRAFPDAMALVELAMPKFLREEFQRPTDVRAVYLRRADAEINWERHRGIGAGPRG